MSRQYSVAIIGCGSIGALKDEVYDSPTTDAVLTHAHAFHIHSRTNIIGFVDTDYNKAERAGLKWRTGAFTSLYSPIERYNVIPDIVVVATPTETHRDTLMQVLEFKPKLVVAEKPFCSTLKEAQEVHDAYALAQIPIVVNYTRRFDPITAQVFNDLRDGKYGDVYHARCIYGRGLKRDGCHGLDIFNWIFGQLQGLSYNRKGIIDYLPFDPSYTLRLEYEKCQEVYMIGTDSRAWGAFELDFITEKGVLRFTDWGKTFRHFGVERESTYGQYHALQTSTEKISTGLTKALLYMSDNCVGHLRDGEPLLCTSADAIRVHEILEQVKA